MRSFKKVTMSNFNSLIRGGAVAAALLAGAAWAQAPANDSCAGAEVLTLGAGPVTSSTATRFDLAAAAVETPFACSTSSVKNSVWYTFTPSATGVYRMDTCGPVTNFDTVIQAYSGTCGALTPEGTSSTGCNDQGGCTYANASAITLPLTGGTTYFVQVAVWSSVTLDPALVTALTVTPINPPANDTCDGTVPALTVNSPLAVSTNAATNDDSQLGGNLDGGAGTCFAGVGHSTTAAANASPGRDVVMRFTPPSTAAYNFRLSAPRSSGPNSVLYLTDSCVAATVPPQLYSPPQCIAATNRAGTSTSAAEELVCVPLTTGVPVFVWADETTQSASGANFEVEVTECFPEAEPNDTPALANTPSCPTTARIWDAGTGADVDFYALGTNPAGSRVFAMLEAQASSTNGSTATDFDLRVTTAADTLEVDTTDLDSLFGFSTGAVAGTPLPAGVPTFLRVNYSSITTPREPYRVYSVVQTGTAVAELEPNDTPVAANGAGGNYFSGDVSATTDVDVFAFEARAGELVYLALDSQPGRSGTTATGNHTLQLLDSAITIPTDGGAPSAPALVAVNDANTTVNNTVVTGSLTSTSPALPSESLIYRVRATGTYFARVGRTSATGTGGYLLSISKDCTAGGGITAPSVTAVNPASGSVLGNETITISGTNFSPLARVTIGGAAAVITSRTSTSLQVTTPAGNEGAVDVVVSNPGNQPGTLTGGFTYIAPIAPPTITSVTPAGGPTAGGTVITVVGTLFKAGALVTLTVGGTGVQATNVIIDSATRLRATTPAHAPGLASITVRNPVDALEGSRADVFTYIPAPRITSITPNTGFTSGGQLITIVGADFMAGATVRFGANTAPAVNVTSSTSITVTTPTSLVTGPVDVTVINPDTQQSVSAGGFTYAYPAPTITAVTPASGPAVGGTSIVITGTGFQVSPAVRIGGTPATNVTRTSLTQVTAVTPPGMHGVVDVTLTNSDAQSATLAGGFRYQAAPTISAVTPASGAAQGGTRITITGQYFLQGASVRLGGVPAFAVTVTSPTTATAITNSSAPGAVDVVLVNPDTQSGTLTAGYTYEGAPSLTSLSPISGSTAGGTVVTIIGAGFLPNTAVTFGTIASPTVTRVSNTELTAVTPASPVGVVTVTVRNPDGQSASLPGGFRFVAPPTITAVTPSSGDVAGGAVITITGTGFNASTTVSFDGTPAAQVSLVSATELAAVTPRHAPGVVDVEVSTGGAAATLTDGFTFTRGAPTLATVAPVSGPITGGTLLTLSGTGFAQGASVTVGGAAATDVVVVSDVLARAVVPAHAAGAVDVVFTNDDNQSATLAGGFTYVAPPSNNAGTVVDGGTGSVGEDPAAQVPGGGVSCGCSSFDGSMFSMAGFGLLLVLSRRRRRS